MAETDFISAHPLIGGNELRRGIGVMRRRERAAHHDAAVSLAPVDLSSADWTDVVSSFEDLSLLQTWEYAAAKEMTGRWQAHRALFVQDDVVVGAVQALVRRAPVVGGGLAWINRGPLWRRGDRPSANLAVLEGMLSQLRSYWVDGQGMYLRVGPPVSRPGLSAETLGDAGLRGGAFPGWASTRVDLTPALDELRRRLKQKWRNCLNKAERSGIDVEVGSGDELFREFMELYERSFAQRSYETTVTPDLVGALRRALPEAERLVVHVVRRDGELLAGLVTVRYGAVTEYLVGVIPPAGRRVNAGQLLLWRALSAARDAGSRWFDLGGTDPDLTPAGILHFKAGLGGEDYRLMDGAEADDGRVRSRLLRRFVAAHA